MRAPPPGPGARPVPLRPPPPLRPRTIGLRRAAAPAGRGRRPAGAAGLVRGTLASLGLLLLWQVAIAASFDLPPLRATAAVLLLTGALLWLYVGRTARGRGRRVRAALRLRGPGAAGRWVRVALPLWLLLHLSQTTIWLQSHSVPVEPTGRLALYTLQPLGWLPFLLTLVLLAPLLEEVFFRGFIQRRFERRLGPAPALALTALLFALLHFEPGRFPLLLSGGVVFGAAVYCSRSLWAGVALHVSANASTAAAALLLGGPEDLSRARELGALPHLLAALAAAGLLRAGWGAWHAARGRTAPPLLALIRRPGTPA